MQRRRPPAKPHPSAAASTFQRRALQAPLSRVLRRPSARLFADAGALRALGARGSEARSDAKRERGRCSVLLRALTSLALIACNGGAAGGEHEHAEHAPRAEHGAYKTAQRDRVEIDREMLRDLRITTSAAEARPAGGTVTVLGELQVNEDAYAEVSSPIEARIARVLAVPGDEVSSGQPLVELESAEVGKARAALEASAARATLARSNLQRKSELAAEQIIARRELQSSQSELSQAEAEQRAARSSLAALGAADGGGTKFTLKAPLAGTVIERNALRGRTADPSRPLFAIGDLRRLWLLVHAFERDAVRMRVQTSARVTFSALPGQSFTGQVTRTGSRVDPTSRTVEVRVEIDNPEGKLRPGMAATANLSIGDSNETIVTVPLEAVQRQAHGWCVFIPTEQEGHFAIRPVGRGRDLGAEVEILSGLRAGEPVVVDGAFLLKAEADKAGGSDEHHHH
jgi:membrane fusion protein, heavy metal efflux system